MGIILCPKVYDLDMNINDTKAQSRQRIGEAGETYVKKLLISKGYLIYKTNFRKWGLEMDIIAYKFNLTTNVLEVRVIEVKTRSFYNYVDLAELNIASKIRSHKTMLYDLGDQIKGLLKERGDLGTGTFVYIKYYLDLAIIGFQKEKNTVHLQKYIQNINLLM